MKFFISHTVPKNQERVFPKTRKVFSALETSEKTYLPLRKIFFFKKVLGKKSCIMPINPKRDPLGSSNVFYKPTTSKKIKGVPFDRILKISKKSHSAGKKPLVYPLLLWQWLRKVSLALSISSNLLSARKCRQNILVLVSALRNNPYTVLTGSSINRTFSAGDIALAKTNKPKTAQSR